MKLNGSDSGLTFQRSLLSTAPDMLMVTNTSTINSVWINAGFGSVADTNINGPGTVIGPRGTVQIRLNNTYVTDDDLRLSAASDGDGVLIYVTPGVL
jgi:hypothetical protein